MSSVHRFAVLGVLAIVVHGGAGTGSAARAAEPAALPLLVDEKFDAGADRWRPLDPDTWKIGAANGEKFYSQFKKGKYKPPHRSPENFALLHEPIVGDFVFEARARSTVKDYGHRDMCVIFGHQDAAHFYYVHLGKQTDDHANQIFIVNGAPRTKISTKTSTGTNWDDNWRRVKVARNAAAGSIEVYFDDLKTPVMTATDKTFAWGRIGIGTFDDTGDWDDVTLRGLKVEPPQK